MSETTTRPNNGSLFRRLSFLLLLILLLLGVNLLYLPALNYNAVQAGEAGELLYAAGFDGFVDEWQQYPGRNSAQIVNGVMQISLESNDIIYSASSPVYADFDVSVTMRATSGELESDGYGIIFRLSDTADDTVCQRQLLTLCNLEKAPLLDFIIPVLAPAPKPRATGYYVFLISPDGYYSIWRTGENSIEQLTVWHNSNGLLNTGLNTDNRIRIVGRDADFQFYLNGSLVNLCVPFEGERLTGDDVNCVGEVTNTWHDETFATGKIGLIVNAGTVAPVSAEFDNFVVTMPPAQAEGSDL